MRYRVEIIEYLAKTFTVEASSEEDAISKIKDRCDSGNIFLDNDDFLEREIRIAYE